MWREFFFFVWMNVFWSEVVSDNTCAHKVILVTCTYLRLFNHWKYSLNKLNKISYTSLKMLYSVFIRVYIPYIYRLYRDSEVSRESFFFFFINFCLVYFFDSNTARWWEMKGSKKFIFSIKSKKIYLNLYRKRLWWRDDDNASLFNSNESMLNEGI